MMIFVWFRLRCQFLHVFVDDLVAKRIDGADQLLVVEDLIVGILSAVHFHVVYR